MPREVWTTPKPRQWSQLCQNCDHSDFYLAVAKLDAIDSTNFFFVIAPHPLNLGVSPLPSTSPFGVQTASSSLLPGPSPGSSGTRPLTAHPDLLSPACSTHPSELQIYWLLLLLFCLHVSPPHILTLLFFPHSKTAFPNPLIFVGHW